MILTQVFNECHAKWQEEKRNVKYKNNQHIVFSPHELKVNYLHYALLLEIIKIIKLGQILS